MLVLLYGWSMVCGLGASLLGALWPVMYLDFNVALSSIGVFSWIGSGVGFATNLAAGRFLKKFGADKTVVACSVTVALTTLGYAWIGQFWAMCLLLIPNSFAGGIISVAMNDYLAQHYPSRHMNWVHCLWGVGSLIGPNLVAYSLRQGFTWHFSYHMLALSWALCTLAVCFVLLFNGVYQRCEKQPVEPNFWLDFFFVQGS